MMINWTATILLAAMVLTIFRKKKEMRARGDDRVLCKSMDQISEECNPSWFFNISLLRSLNNNIRGWQLGIRLSHTSIKLPIYRKGFTRFTLYIGFLLLHLICQSSTSFPRSYSFTYWGTCVMSMHLPTKQGTEPHSRPSQSAPSIENPN